MKRETAAAANVQIVLCRAKRQTNDSLAHLHFIQNSHNRAAWFLFKLVFGCIYSINFIGVNFIMVFGIKNLLVANSMQTYTM